MRGSQGNRRVRVVFATAVALLGVTIAASAAYGDAGRVKDINPGPEDSGPSFAAVLGRALIFQADDGEHGAELWRSNGTEAGTKLVRNLKPGADGSFPTWTTRLGERVLFFATGKKHGHELWRTDGTKKGTRLVKDINRGPDDSVSPSGLTPVIGTGRLFNSAADDGKHGLELCARMGRGMAPSWSRTSTRAGAR